MRNNLKQIKELFSGWAIFLHLVLYYAVNVAYLYVLTRNDVISLIVAAPAAILCFNIFSSLHKKLDKRRLTLHEINKYTTSLTFYLNSGQNPLFALENTMPYVHPILQEDIKKTIHFLKTEARLVTAHFEKHQVASLDLYHQTLRVKYEKGGDAKEMFLKPFKSVQFEVKEVDDLMRKKSSVSQQIYFMDGISCGIAGVIAFLPGGIYLDFLTVKFSIVIVLLFYAAILFNLYSLQKDKADISLRM